MVEMWKDYGRGTMTDEKDIIDSGSHMLNFGSATKEKSSAKEHCCQVWLSSFREKKIC